MRDDEGPAGILLDSYKAINADPLFLNEINDLDGFPQKWGSLETAGKSERAS